jgi:hypothetical protein
MPDTLTWTPHLRMSYGGTLGAPAVEIWTNTVKWKVTGFEPDAALLQAACDAVTPIVSAWIARSGSLINSAALLTWVKLNWIGANGKQRDTNTVQTDLAPGTAGGNSASTPAFSQTQAITLRTRVNRGRGHAGRVYPPVTVFAADGAGSPYLDAGLAGGMATSFTTFLRDARAALAGVFVAAFPGSLAPDPAVFSGGSALKGTQPLWTPIISAVVDRVPDVQHRRTNRIPRAEGATILLDP